MKLKDLGDSIIFDAFPLAFNPNQKIILTHLFNLEEQTFPPSLPMIYTTQQIADQLLKYCRSKSYKCVSPNNINIIEPYQFIDIVLEKRRTLQILFCSSDSEVFKNLMVLIRENGQLNYIYAGNFLDIRSALLNDTFAAWIAPGVDKLCLNLKRCDENPYCNDIDQMEKVFNSIEDVMNYFPESIIHLYFPLFGYENFIFKLANRFRQRVSGNFIYEVFFKFLNKNLNLECFTHFCDNNEAKIFLFADCSSYVLAKRKFTESNIITINILKERSRCMNRPVDLKNPYYELFYSPEPSPFHLKLLSMLVKPRRIFGILDKFNNTSKVPLYLIELCVGAKERLQQKQQRKLNESLSPKAPPKTILVGPTLSKQNNNKKGPFLSESESDSDL